MSVADLVQLAEAIRIERRKLTPTERHLRWVRKNRTKWNAYRRNWRQQRREKGLRVI